MSKQNRDHKDFVKLEYSVLDLIEYNGQAINGNMKILLSLVYSYDNTGRTYYESVGTIGKRCGCKPEAVRNFRNKLRDAGMITFEEEKGRSHKISPVELAPSLMVFFDDNNSGQTSSRKVETEESDQHDNVSSGDVVNQITIFDENGVVTEEFINSADNPRIGRNEDGTVESYQYTYARAKTEQAYQDGKSSPQEIEDSWRTFYDAAQPRHIPSHLLPRELARPSNPFTHSDEAYQEAEEEEIPF